MTRRIERALGGAFDWTIHHVLRALPTPVASAIGVALGAFAGRFTRRRWAARAGETLARLRPDLDRRTRDRLLRRRWRHLGRTAAEYACLHRLLRERRIAVEGDPEGLAALAAPGPRIVVSAHFGNWETIGPVVMDRAGRLTAPYEPPGSPVRHRLVKAARARYGARTTPAGRSAAFALARALKADVPVVMFMDAIREGRRQAPVFVGPPRPDGNLAAAARLAARFGATLIPAYCLRGDGARFRVVFEAPLRADPEADAEAEVRRLAEALNARLLAWALAWPEQWSMLHARPWRSARLHEFRPVRPAPSACQRARAG